MQMELKGVSCLPLEWVAPPKKQLGIAQGFGVLVESLEEMREAAAFKGSEEAAKARKEKLAIKEMNVWIQTNPFSDAPQYENLQPVVFPVATQDTATLMRAVEGAVTRLYKPGYGYKRIGVWATKLEPEDCVQGHLWVRPEREKKPRLLALMDRINEERGRGTLRMASVGVNQRWLTRFEKQSPHYTTRWSDVPVARAG
jgi:DNA polymerase V